MSGNVTQYALLLVTVNNALLQEAQSVELDRAGGGQIIDTLAKRFSGISPGSSKGTIKVTNAVPAAGHEIDFGEEIDGYIPVELGIARSDGKEAKATFFIMSDSLRQGVDQAAAYSFDAIGALPKFE
jgi:hypothetical protein